MSWFCLESGRRPQTRMLPVKEDRQRDLNASRRPSSLLRIRCTRDRVCNLGMTLRRTYIALSTTSTFLDADNLPSRFCGYYIVLQRTTTVGHLCKLHNPLLFPGRFADGIVGIHLLCFVVVDIAEQGPPCSINFTCRLLTSYHHLLRSWDLLVKMGCPLLMLLKSLRSLPNIAALDQQASLAMQTFHLWTRDL